jgi:hypothetical protein
LFTVYQSFCPYVNLSVSLSLFLRVSFSLLLSSLSLFVCLSLGLLVSLSLSLFVCLSLCISVSLSVCLFVFILVLSLCPSVFLSLCHSVSLSLFSSSLSSHLFSLRWYYLSSSVILHIFLLVGLNRAKKQTNHSPVSLSLPPSPSLTQVVPINGQTDRQNGH